MPQPTELVLVGFDGRIRKRLHKDDGYTNFAQWSPDGRRIMYWEWDNSTFNYGRQRVMNSNGSDNTIFVDTRQQDELAAWSPDGKHVAATANEGAYGPVGLDVHDVATGKSRRIYRRWAYGVSW